LAVQVLPAAGSVPAGQAPTTSTQAPEVRQQALWVWIGQRLGEQVLPGAAVVPVGHGLPMKVKQVPFG
jgi:hypothetical protein